MSDARLIPPLGRVFVPSAEAAVTHITAGRGQAARRPGGVETRGGAPRGGVVPMYPQGAPGPKTPPPPAPPAEGLEATHEPIVREAPRRRARKST